MSKLLEDPKIAVLVEKEATKAVKAERVRALNVVKGEVEANKTNEDKVAKKSVAGILKNITDGIKAA